MSDSKRLIRTFDLSDLSEEDEFISGLLRDAIWERRPVIDNSLRLQVLEAYVEQLGWKAALAGDLERLIGLAEGGLHTFITQYGRMMESGASFRPLPTHFAENYVFIYPPETEFTLLPGTEVQLYDHSVIHMQPMASRLEITRPLMVGYLEFLVRIEAHKNRLEVYSDQSMVIEWSMTVRLFSHMENMHRRLSDDYKSVATDPQGLLKNRRIDLPGRWSEYFVNLSFD